MFLVVFASACLDDDKKPVDQWFLFKHPGPSGYHFGTTFIVQYQSAIDSIRSPLVYTLEPIYRTKVDYVMYNDHPPHQSEYESRAHSKGVLVLGEERFIFITHSIPRFPPPKSDGYILLEDYTYGQHVFCMTDSMDKLSKLVDSQRVSRPKIYDFYLSNRIAKAYPYLYQWIIEDSPIKKPSVIYSLTSSTILSKSARSGLDFYIDLVAPYFNQALYVETWQNGAHTNYMPSDCLHGWNVFNVRQVCMGTCWNHTRDHSKWAIGNRPLVCISDINRQYSQEKRGGLAMCIQNQNLWEFLHQSIHQVEACQKLNFIDLKILE